MVLMKTIRLQDSCTRSLPLGRADKVLSSLGGTGGSVAISTQEQLDPPHVQPGAAAKETLLHPTVLSPLARAELTFHRRRELYTCPTGIYSFDCGRNVTDGRGTMRPSCGDPMMAVARYVPPAPAAAGDVGFVRGGDAARYVVTDDLCIMPAPTTAGEMVALFTALGFGNLGALQKSDVQLGFTEGKEILKASLQSTAVLTDVFLRRRAAGDQQHS